MLGPSILTATMSHPTAMGRDGRAWNYHSRSDQHSKVACWTVLLDLLRECDAFRHHAADGKIGFALNHVLAGRIQKTLDLVVCRVPETRYGGTRRTFRELVEPLSVVLSDEQRAVLDELPSIVEERRDDVSEVLLAVEAKACMTAHSKAIPRLFAEILATGFLAKRAAPNCMTMSYSMVNAADSFLSPGQAKPNRHQQPEDAAAVVEMLGKAIPNTQEVPHFGYDGIGVIVVKCRNDGSAVELVAGRPSPATNDHHNYERMIRSVCSEYRRRFALAL